MPFRLPKLRNLQHSDFFQVFNRHEEKARGRSCMLGSAVLTTLVSDLTAGTLYTAFLAANHFSIVDAGILTFLPLLASCFSLLSPLILERFRRRKWVLAGGRLAYYTINILGITLIPYLVHDQQAKLFWFGAIVFLANLINSLFASGYLVWHLNFIPNNIRAKYLSYQQMLTALLSGVALIGSGLVADSLRGTPNEALVLTLLRLLGYGLAILDVTLLVLPKEYDYPHSQTRVRLSNVFRLPLHNRKFMRTMGIITLWVFLSYLSNSAYTYYLLNTVHTGVTIINTMSFIYGFFLLALTPFWQRVLKRHDWFRTFAYAAFLNVPTIVAGAFIRDFNYLWLYPIIRLCQHALGVGLNLTWANFPYINTPKEDQTYYISFHQLITFFVAFLGQLVGTQFVRVMGDRSFPLFGMEMGSVQLLIFAQAALNLVCGILILRFLPQLTPDPVEEDEAIPATTQA